LPEKENPFPTLPSSKKSTYERRTLSNLRGGVEVSGGKRKYSIYSKKELVNALQRTGYYREGGIQLLFYAKGKCPERDGPQGGGGWGGVF